MLRTAMEAIDLDLRHRALTLSKMKLLPKFYGQDISSVFRQKYHGNVREAVPNKYILIN